MVPVFFEPYARRLAERLKDMTSGHVLEIAAGTGVVTRELIRMLPESVAITATDLRQPMLDRAQSHTGSERVRWQRADALALPFDDSSFDAIVCQFGVMFFADKQAAFREALRVLKPGGRFLFEVWDRREEIVIQYTASEIVGRALSLDPSSLLAPPYHDVTTVRADLAAAGLIDLSFETLPERSRTGSAREAAMATCQGGYCVAISSRTLRIVSKRSPKLWPQLWLKSSVRDRSMRLCRPSCSHRFAQLRFNPNVLVEAIEMENPRRHSRRRFCRLRGDQAVDFPTMQVPTT